MSFTRQYGNRVSGQTLTRDETRAVFGQVMGLVALTVGCAALGAYIGRNLTGGTGLLLFIGVFACMFGLQFGDLPRARAARDRAAVRARPADRDGRRSASSPCTPRAIRRCSGSPRERPEPSSVGSAPTATRPGAIFSVVGADACSGRCSALIVVGFVLIFVNVPGGNLI